MLRSLGGRLQLTLVASLALFFGLTIWALDNAYQHALERAVRDRLETQVLGLIAATESDRAGRPVLPELLPETRFNNPGSGLLAQLADGRGAQLWRSRSAAGTDVAWPAHVPVGERRFRADISTVDGEALFVLTLGVEWEETGTYRFSVAETQASYTGQVRRFRTQLFGWFALMALGLVLAQAALLRWVLAPLRRVATELRAVETGERSELGGDYPSELVGLTKGLNALIRNERGRLERYRNSLGDLAHSLKTPLAVVRSALTRASLDSERTSIGEQLERMDEIVEYQLQRASASGGTTFGAPLSVRPVVQRIVESLRKVYAERDLAIDAFVADEARFHGDAGDLMEIVGNLADNACKHARRRVTIDAGRIAPGRDADRDGLFIVVSDDGPGIPAAKVDELAQRGVRGDTTAPGHGIGLAIVQDLVALHGGRVVFGPAELGGAEVRVELPPV
jgi:two-component system sensor histidine kinase PhoQ